MSKFLLLLLLVVSLTGIAQAAGNTYVCPMHPEEVSDSPGTCSICGMDLVKKEDIKNVAIFIFDGVQIIDYTAPYEIFGQQKFNVYTVAESSKAISTSMNMSVNPAYSFQNAPKPYILVVPGGNVDPHVDNTEVIRWIQSQAQQAEYVLSVCNGGFFLAKAGLLDGLSATTFHRLIADLKTAAPKTKVVSDKRYVDNGKIITSAGLSSGIDGSLYLVSKIFGIDRARELALHLEYDWRPESDFARANLADRLIPDLDISVAKEWHPIRNLGDKQEWEVRGTFKAETSAAEFLKIVNDRMKKHWSLISTDNNTSVWSFKDETGRPWKGIVDVQPVAAEPNKYEVSVKIKRVG